MKEKKQLYEGMYILSVTLSEEARRKALDKIVNGIIGYDGEIHKIHDQGRRKLAYQMRGFREGYYYLLYFTVATSAMPSLWNDYQLNEDLVRFLTLKTDEVKETLEYQLLPE
ncbi:30S ribosomal protein S6 [Candidatus Clavichlamydia salmonicola]|uniref:30S ribosomal protein S6 n=1 Tax=Candidatus Clavichlamydia salmonicola TaxID=469812 RepID=UPI00189148A5|nr:30S ribosomal protein S6 [Candidatus Clavichlamydia salmonicola]